MLQNKTLNLFKKFEITFLIATRNFLLLGIILFALTYITNIEVDSYINKKWLYLLLLCSGSSYLFFYLKLNHKQKESIIALYSKFIFLGCIMFMTLASFRIRYLEDIFIKIKPYYLYTFLIALFAGLFAFYFNRNELNYKENSLSTDKTKNILSYNKIVLKMNSFLKNKRFLNIEFSTVILIAITIIFITIKIIMPLVFTGGYVDEYLHLTVAKELLKNHQIPQIQLNTEYTRGAIVSILLLLFFKLFSPTLLVGKLAISIVGLINYILLLKIGLKLKLNKTLLYIVLLIYTFSPWVILNHFYIRMYIFEEFTLLLITYLYIKLSEEKSWATLILLLTTLFSQYFLINDDGYYFVLVFAIILLSKFFLFEIHKMPFKTTSRFKNILSNTKIKVFLLLFPLLYLLAIGEIQKKLYILLNGNVSYTSGIKFDYIFFDLNLFFTFLVFLSIVFIGQLGSKAKILKEILLAFLTIFVLHLFSSKDFQILRAISYILPFYYLCSIISVNYIGKLFKSNILKLYLFFSLAFILFLSYPPNFFQMPQIPTELFYKEYTKAFEFIKNNCNNKDIYYLTNGPFVADFYDINIKSSYIIYENRKLNPLYKEDLTGYYTVYKNHPIIIDAMTVDLVLKQNSHLCIVTNTEMKESYNFLNPNTFNFLNDNYSQIKLEGLTVFYR